MKSREIILHEPKKEENLIKKRLLLALALTFVYTTVCRAQSNQVAFTWSGGSSAELTTINGQPTNQATGYAGGIQIVNGSILALLSLPDSLDLPNNGFLDCWTALTFGEKQWGKRADGSTMDGSKAGDSYMLPAATACPLWNGTALISLSEYRQMVAYKYCYRGACKTSLIDTLEGGRGAVTQ